jgi:hypothetical protein
VFAQTIVSTGRFIRDALAACIRKMRDWLQAENLAEAKGLSLLQEWLTDEQRRQFALTNAFEVRGCDSQKRYRIQYGNVANVHELDDSGTPIKGFCFVPTGGLVTGDVMLAQKIALETGEKDALAVANSFPVQKHERNVPLLILRRAY